MNPQKPDREPDRMYEIVDKHATIEFTYPPGTPSSEDVPLPPAMLRIAELERQEIARLNRRFHDRYCRKYHRHT
jgi:hypothetical protein